MKIIIKAEDKSIEVPDVTKCNGMGKISGLMFQEAKKADAVLFDFGYPTMQAIHSYFCPHFIAVWLDESGNILEWRKISGRMASITPESEFSKLLEIPLNSKYASVVEFLSRIERFK